MSSSQRLDGTALVAAFQRLDQRPVMMRAGHVAQLVMDLRRRAHIGTGLQPQAFDDRDQHGRPGRAIDVEMEGVIELGRPVRLVGVVAA